MKIRKSNWFALIAMLTLVGIAVLLVDTVPPQSRTLGSMHMCKRRVLRYAQEHGRLPSALSDTDPIQDYNSSIKDGWGVDLYYSVDSNDVVTFRSLGKDHALGGLGDDRDMIGIFSAREPDGSWSDEFVGWQQEPFDAGINREPD